MNLRSTIFAVLFPMTAMAAGTSAHYTLTADALDAAGSAGASAHYSHGGHMRSPAGTGASSHYENTVGFHAATAPELPPEIVVSLVTGGDVPGLPGAKFAGANELPGPFSGDAVLTKIKLANGLTVVALVRPSGVLVKVGDTLAGTGNAVISKLYAMSRGAFLAELKLGTGSPVVTLANNKLVCFDTGMGIELVARSGNVAPGGLTAFKAFHACAGDAEGDVFYKAILSDLTNVDTGLWVRPFAGASKLLVKEGHMVDVGNGVKRVNSVAAFPTVSKSQAEGRVLYGEHSVILRLTVGGDHAIVVIPAEATGPADWTVIARTGGDAPGGVGKFSTLGLPAVEDTNVAFRAALKLSASVSSANNAIVVAGGSIIARKGSVAPGTSNVFSSFADPAVGAAGQASFIAKLAGATTLSDDAIWEIRANVLSLVARESYPAPGLGAISIRSIARYAHPGGGLGPCFLATLNGVPLSTSVALFGVPAAGGPAVDLARTGDQFNVVGTMRTLTAIKALKMDLGSEGIARGYNNTSVFIVGSFGVLRSALIELPVVP